MATECMATECMVHIRHGMVIFERRLGVWGVHLASLHRGRCTYADAGCPSLTLPYADVCRFWHMGAVDAAGWFNRHFSVMRASGAGNVTELDSKPCKSLSQCQAALVSPPT